MKEVQLFHVDKNLKKKMCFMYFILFLTKVIKMFASYIPLCFKNPDYLGELK